MDDRFSNLVFLSGIAAVALPGCDSDDGTTGGSASATATAPATVGGTGVSEDTEGSSGSAGTSDADTADDTDTADGTDDATTGVDPADAPPVCLDYATWISGCDPAYAYQTALTYCATQFSSFEMGSAACASAYEELLVCLMGLDCSVVGLEEPPPECADQNAGLAAACGFSGGGE